MLSSVEQAFVGREEIRSPLKTPAGEASVHPDGLQHGGRKPTETSVIEFCCKSVNLFFEELINIKVIRFLIDELLR